MGFIYEEYVTDSLPSPPTVGHLEINTTTIDVSRASILVAECTWIVGSMTQIEFHFAGTNNSAGSPSARVPLSNPSNNDLVLSASSDSMSSTDNGTRVGYLVCKDLPRYVAVFASAYGSSSFTGSVSIRLFAK